MAEDGVVFAIRNLRSELLQFNVKNFPEIRVRMEQIPATLKILLSILEAAESMQDEDEDIGTWVANTKQVFYETEDLLLVANSPRRGFGSSFRNFNPLRDVRHLEKKIAAIQSRITALGFDSRVSDIKPRELGIINPLRRRRRGRMCWKKPDDDFVGLVEDVENLVAQLVEKNGVRDFEIMSIFGRSGIGKTSLAKVIYRNDDVRSHFQAFAWIDLSQQLDLKDILRGILVELEPEKRRRMEHLRVEELYVLLFDVQLRKPCLTVLDNVWDKDVLKKLRPAFPNRRTHSKILITTRDWEIAQRIDTCASCNHYEQRDLNESESWVLLKNKIQHGQNIIGRGDDGYIYDSEDENGLSSAKSFHSCQTNEDEDEEDVDNLDILIAEDDIHDFRNQIDVERLGMKMVRQCERLPLALILLGGVLRTKSTLSEWIAVNLRLTSFSSKGGSRSQHQATVHEVLSLSYYDLPYQLKRCLLHLGSIPEDFKISPRKFYSLWAAEGFTLSESNQGEENESIADIGERYLDELVKRYLVHVQADEITGRFKSIRLHDFTRELCLLKADEEIFFQNISPRWETNQTSSPSSSSTATPIIFPPRLSTRWETNRTSSPSSSSAATPIIFPRRLSIAVDYGFDDSLSMATIEHIRSALFFSGFRDRRPLHPTLNYLCKETKVLRVLSLERFSFGEKLSKAIGNLVHLRYLSLRNSLFDKLPSSIANLKYLQTLDLRVSSCVYLAIPNVIYKLNQLRHLYLPPFHTCAERLQLNSLAKLETLKNFNSGQSDYRDIFKLSKLQKLAAIIDLEIKSLEAIYTYVNTETANFRDFSLRLHHYFESEKDLLLLRKLVGSIHLRKLDLHGLVAKLPEHGVFAQCLEKLILRNSALEEDPMITLEKLPNLRYLALRSNAINRNTISCSANGFPQLRFLEFQGLQKLQSCRVEQGAMPKLCCLSIDECNNLKMVPEGIKFASSLRYLVIANMPNSFKLRVRKVNNEEGEDYKNIEHIPSIKIVETNQRESPRSGSVRAALSKSFSPDIVPKEWKN